MENSDNLPPRHPSPEKKKVITPSPNPLQDVLGQSRQVEPLSAALYHEAFNNGFVPRSTGKGAKGSMTWKTRDLLDQLPSCESVMSIGAGTGFIDGSIFGDRSLKRYFGVEPNPHHVTKLRENTSKHQWDTVSIAEGAFDENFDTEKAQGNKFDCVLITHCLYFMKNPIEAIKHAQSFTNKQGATIILHQTDDTGICPFFRHFTRRFGLQWDPNHVNQDSSFSTLDISSKLQKEGIRLFIGQEHEGMYADEFGPSAPNKDIQNLILSFFLDTDVRKLPQKAQEEMVKYVYEKCRKTDDDRLLFDHPQGFIVVPNEESDWIPKGMEQVKYIWKTPP